MSRRINSIKKKAVVAGKKTGKTAKTAVKKRAVVKKTKINSKPKIKSNAAAPKRKKAVIIKVKTIKTVKKAAPAGKKNIQLKYAEPKNENPKNIVLNAVKREEELKDSKPEDFKKEIKKDVNAYGNNIEAGADIDKDVENEIDKDVEIHEDVERNIEDDFKKDVNIDKSIDSNIEVSANNVDLEKDVNADKESDAEIENAEEPKAGRSLGLYRKIALSFIILTVALLSVIFYFSFVKVSIYLIPSKEKLSGNLIIDVIDKDKKNIKTEDSMEILGEVEQVEIEETKIYYAGGVDIIGEEVTGKVIITNNYNKNQPLVATTRLISNNKLFRIKNTVNVPAGGSIEVEVYADEPDPDMAIGPANFIIPGLWAGLQDKIYGESKEPMKYSKKIKKHIRQSDIDDGVKDLKASLLVKAKREIGENYQNYDEVIYEIDNNSISQEVDGKVGEEKDEFSISMKTKVVVVAFNENKIFKKAEQNLFSALPDDKDLAEINKEDISYGLNNYNISQGTASLSIGFSGQIAIKDGNSIVSREKILGLNHQQLNDYLNNIQGITVSKVEFYPSFIKKVPNLVDRIEIVITN